MYHPHTTVPTIRVADCCIQFQWRSRSVVSWRCGTCRAGKHKAKQTHFKCNTVVKSTRTTTSVACCVFVQQAQISLNCRGTPQNEWQCCRHSHRRRTLRQPQNTCRQTAQQTHINAGTAACNSGGSATIVHKCRVSVRLSVRHMECGLLAAASSVCDCAFMWLYCCCYRFCCCCTCLPVRMS